jgi:hypothetical protein
MNKTNIKVLKRSRVPNWLVIEDAAGKRHEIHLDSLIAAMGQITISINEEYLKKHIKKRRRLI